MDLSITMTSLLRIFLNRSLIGFVFCCLISTDAASSPTSGPLVVYPHSAQVLVDTVLTSLSDSSSSAARIVEASGFFLGRPYKENTLIGDLSTQEVLFADFSVFDCFTFLDVVEALRRSRGTEDFLSQLIHVRYKDNDVAYLKRRHFFSDWVNPEAHDIIDVTETIDPDNVRMVRKRLNMRSDGSAWITGLPAIERTIFYLPSTYITKQTFENLENGDYLGFYSSKDGLDVKHTGIFIKSGDRPVLRHASSIKRLVVDVDLLDYLQGQEGLVVYRVRSDE